MQDLARWWARAVGDHEAVAILARGAVVAAFLRGGYAVALRAGDVCARHVDAIGADLRHPAMLAPWGLVDADKRTELCNACIGEQEGERDHSIQPVWRALMQAAVATPANPDRVLNVVPELREVATKALRLQRELLEKPSLWRNRSDRERRVRVRRERVAARRQQKVQPHVKIS